MMSHEQRLDVESLAKEESELRERAMQRVTLEYREAARLEGHLQGVAAETPEPTVAFRMDSKRQYLSDDRGLDRQTLIIFVPKDSDPNDWITRFWAKFTRQDGVEAFYEVDQNGARPYLIAEELEEDVEAMEVSDLEFSMENIIRSSVAQKQQSIAGLRRLTDALREEFIHVPFRS